MAKKKRKIINLFEDDECSLEMTAMIDVVFLLLIFFMCATKFKVPDYRLDALLPRDKGLRSVQVKPPKELPEFRITIDPITPLPSEGKLRATFRIGRDMMVRYDQLDEIVKREYWVIKNDARYHGENIPAVIDGHKDVDFQYVIKAINSCIGAKVDEVNFAPPIPDDIRDRMGKVLSTD